MRSLSTLLLLGAQPFALHVVATKDWWMQGLPKCWQGCFSDTRPGCSSSKCICQTTGDNGPYLPSAVSCAVSKCKANEWALDLVLGPLALYCAAVQNPIPDQVMKEAYAAASDSDDDDEPPRPTPKPSAPPPAPSKPGNPLPTTRRSEITQELTSTISSTFTRTTIESGNTLQIIVPIIIGPNGMFTGGASTSTITGELSSAAAPSSQPPSPNPSAAAPSSPSSHGAQPSSTSSSEPTRRPASGNGSPFENMQAGASTWTVSAPLMGLAVFAMLLVRY